MKKILFVSLVVLFCFTAKAQKHRIDIGVETGLSLIGVQIVPKSDNYSVTMFQYDGGLTLLYSFTENLALRTGLFHMSDYGSYKKSNYYPEENLLVRTYASYQSKSINIPLAFRVNYGRRFRVFMDAGIVPGYEYRSIVQRINAIISNHIDTDLLVDNSSSYLSETVKSIPLFRTLIDFRAGCNFPLSSRLMLETGVGLYMTTQPLDLSTDPDFISGKMELPVHLSLYYKI